MPRETVHLFERDCSVIDVTRRSVEIAPAPNLSDDVRAAAATATPIAFAQLDRLRERRHRRVPARHGGRTRRPARLHRDEPAHPGRAHRDRRGHRRRPCHRPRCGSRSDRPSANSDCTQDDRCGCAAPRCSAASPRKIPPTDSVRTPGRSRPTGRPGGGGIRLDGGTIAPGTRISPHFDSMLVKMTCHGRDFATAVARAKRVLAEFRIRGVSTNIPFLRRARRPRLRRRRREHLVHRRAPAAARGRSRRTAAARCSTGSSTSRSTSRTARRREGRPAPRSCRPRPHGARARRIPSATPRTGPRGFARALREQTRWPSPRPPSGTRTSRCSRRACGRRTSRGRARMSRA